ncbi:MAG: glycolate oxidase subunit GlcE [Burkholderiaceae bacterium]
MEFVLAELLDQVMTAIAGHRPMYISGGRSKDFYGNTHRITPSDGHCVVDMSAYKGVIEYHPAELVMTARAGTPLQEIEAVLAEQRQMLAFEPPHFGPHATLGGCVSAGLSGPARMARGSVRDFVLGARLLDGHGRLMSFGGQVVKNVAGYDVSRLLVGAMGSFGALIDISVKVVPKPAVSLTLALAMPASDALASFSKWRLLPLPITATAWQGEPGGATGMLSVRLEGSEVAVGSARRVIGGEPLLEGDAQSFWRGLREHTHPFFMGDGMLWRLSLPPAAPCSADFPCALIEWNGGQRWLRGELPIDDVRAYASRAGGHATLFRAGASTPRPASGVFHPPEPALLSVMQRLKNEFDPWHLFNPGRLLVEA